MEKSQKNRTWLVMILAVVVFLGLLAIRRYGLDQSGTSTSVTSSSSGTTETAKVFIGNLAASASASGRIVAKRSARLAFELPGLVSEVLVRVGDSVVAGQELAALNTADLLLNVAAAEQAVAIQEANLARLQAPARPSQIAAAEAALASAQANLNTLQAGPSAEQIAAAQAAVRAANSNVAGASSNASSVRASITQADILAAEANLATARAQQWSAQVAYDRDVQTAAREGRQVQNQLANELQSANDALAVAQAAYDALLAGPNDNAVDAAQASVSAAAANRDAAQANLDLLLNGATDSQIAAAEAAVAQAQATLEELQNGPSAEQIAITQAQVEQARLTLSAAQDVLKQATLQAPFDGVVTTINIAPGELATGVALELVDTNSFEVILEVNEADVGALAVGQPAVITLEAWPDQAIESQITAIAPQATTGPTALAGPVTYQVHVGLGATALPVRLGMTANANLITANREGVLLVPNRAVRADRTQGTYSVYVMKDGVALETAVTIGLRDSSYTQITGGLFEGDEVVLGTPPGVPTPAPTRQPLLRRNTNQ